MKTKILEALQEELKTAEEREQLAEKDLDIAREGAERTMARNWYYTRAGMVNGLLEAIDIIKRIRKD